MGFSNPTVFESAATLDGFQPSARSAGKLAVRRACPACGDAGGELLHDEAYDSPALQAYLARHYEGRSGPLPRGARYRLMRCAGCALAYQTDVPDQALLEVIYNEWIPGSDFDRDDRIYPLDSYRYLHEQVEFMVEHFRRPPSSLRVLDFGFGWAHWARMAMAYGCQVAGVELSDERREFGRSVGIEVLELARLPRRAFDFIHTEQVFEHLLQPDAVLHALAGALKPGGILNISVPDAGPALAQLERGRAFALLEPALQMSIAPLEHVNAFTHESLVAFGRTAGLEVLRPRLRDMYNSASGLLQGRRLVKVLARPIYRHVLHRGAFVYFTPSAPR